MSTPDLSSLIDQLGAASLEARGLLADIRTSDAMAAVDGAEYRSVGIGTARQVNG